MKRQACKKENKPKSKVRKVLDIVGYIIFGYLTYKPIRNYIFYDKLENKYSIDIYVLDE